MKRLARSGIFSMIVIGLASRFTCVAGGKDMTSLDKVASVAQHRFAAKEVPEPAAYLLVGSALIGFALIWKRGQAKKTSPVLDALLRPQLDQHQSTTHTRVVPAKSSLQ